LPGGGRPLRIRSFHRRTWDRAATHNSGPRPVKIRGRFGFELDGPVYIPKLYNGKDKTFFMASYEGYRLVQQQTSLSTEMPSAFFTGDFSSVPAASIQGGAFPSASE